MDGGSHLRMALYTSKDESKAKLAQGASQAEDGRVTDFPPPIRYPSVYQTSFNPS
jgi:hypothetical protein